jgi:hypothetical protein
MARVFAKREPRPLSRRSVPRDRIVPSCSDLLSASRALGTGSRRCSSIGCFGPGRSDLPPQLGRSRRGPRTTPRAHMDRAAHVPSAPRACGISWLSPRDHFRDEPCHQYMEPRGQTCGSWLSAGVLGVATHRAARPRVASCRRRPIESRARACSIVSARCSWPNRRAGSATTKGWREGTSWLT